MIVKLKFDMFYTTIKVPDVSEKELRRGLYKQFERWLKKQKCYTEKIERTVCLNYDDDAVIKWFQETKFQDSEIEILEKHKSIDMESKYKFDVIIFF